MESKSYNFELLIKGDRDQKKEILRALSDNLVTLGKNETNILISALETEKSQNIKEKIHLILERIIPQIGIDPISRMLRSEDPYTRNAAVEIIKNSPQPLTSYVKWLARDSDKDVRKFAIDAISSEKSPEAIAIIRERLSDDEINIVTTAVEYLGSVEDQESVEDIEQILLETNNKFLQCTCLEALSKIGHSPDSEEIIKKFSKETDPLIHFSYLRYVAEFGQKEDLSKIYTLMNNHPGLLEREALDAIEKIISRCNINEIPSELESALEQIINSSSNSNRKYQALKILAQVSGQNFRSKAREMLESDDEMLKLSAIEILADCGHDEDIDLLEGLAEETDDDELLEAIGDAVSRITQRLESSL